MRFDTFLPDVSWQVEVALIVIGVAMVGLRRLLFEKRDDEEEGR